MDTERVHGGKQALRVNTPVRKIGASPSSGSWLSSPEQIYELTGWLWVQGEGNATLGVILSDAQSKALDWSYGGQTVQAADGWQPVRTRFLIPRGAATILPRLIGTGPATVWLDDAQLKLAGSVQELRQADLPAQLTVSNPRAGSHPADARCHPRRNGPPDQADLAAAQRRAADRAGRARWPNAA